MTDDQGYGDLGFHGHPYIQTPYLDALQKECVEFTNFHVAPACTPTRSQMMTGMDAMVNRGIYPHGQRHLLSLEHTLMPQIFKANGYETALYGKWHLGGNSIYYRPHERGFDDAIYFLRGGHGSLMNYWNSDCFDDFYLHNGVWEEHSGYATDIWFEKGKDFIDKAEKPFFLFLALNAPHEPWMAQEQFRTPYYDKGLPKLDINFFAMISSVDKQVGQFVEFLKSSGKWENTVFIFTSDNGSTLWDQEYNAGLRGKKASVYEGGHRVPFLLHLPKKFKPIFSKTDALTQIQDLLPTFVEICALEVEAGIKSKWNGISFLPMLQGEELPDRKLVVQFEEEKGESAVLWNKWRWVKNKELYDISTDWGQVKDLAAKFPKVAKELKEHYEKWWSRVDLKEEPEPYYLNFREPVLLTAYDWYGGPRVYNWPHLRNAEQKQGKYLIQVEDEGVYRLELRRWPRESSLGLREGTPAFTPADAFLGDLPEGKAISIKDAEIHLDGKVYKQAGKASSQSIPFELNLRKGRHSLSCNFITDTKEKYGAYYVYITPKDTK